MLPAIITNPVTDEKSRVSLNDCLVKAPSSSSFFNEEMYLIIPFPNPPDANKRAIVTKFVNCPSNASPEGPNRTATILLKTILARIFSPVVKPVE